MSSLAAGVVGLGGNDPVVMGLTAVLFSVRFFLPWLSSCVDQVLICDYVMSTISFAVWLYLVDIRHMLKAGLPSGRCLGVAIAVNNADKSVF